MARTLTVISILLLLAGCARQDDPLTPRLAGAANEELVLAGFGESDTVTVGIAGLRVGGYHDFSPYDSLRITFTASSRSSAGPNSEVLVRVGPANTFRVQLALPLQEVSLLVPTALLPKPHSSALTFYASDPEFSLVLARLRVIGWARPTEL